jgi:sarcosine oxidase subunit alpha
MLAGAARIYLNRYGVRPGRRAVVLAACDTAYEAALDLDRAGIEIALIADVRPGHESPAIDAARASGIAVETGTVIDGTQGWLHVSSASIARLAPDGKVIPAGKVSCDLILMSGGWTPSVHLFSQSRGKLAWSEEINAFVPGQSVQAERSAGACRGVFGLAGAVEDGFAAGEAAAGAATGVRRSPIAFQVSPASVDYRGEIGACPSAAPIAAAFVDFQHDVTVKDLKLAAQEGFRSIEHIKRYTTAGMAPDQGKTSNLNAAAIVAQTLGVSVPAAGLTTFRPPYTPVTFGTLAGMSRAALFDPVRRTPVHGWAQEHGAVFEDAGLWKRARYFPRAGESMHQAVARECRTVRTAAGVFDASTLGKIEVSGPDAAAFLDRMYINPLLKLKPGRCRYSILCGENGFVLDDGIAARLAPDLFHVTTATGGAERVLHMMEDYRQTEFTDLKVWLTPVTEQWAVIAVQGPKAREILRPFVDDADLNEAGLPHMSVREARVAGVSARLFRVSFTGELGFEVNVPAGYGRAVWEAILEEAQKHGASAYGTEAMHTLRAEKGYIVVGQETDGTVTPHDAGLAGLIGQHKKDFVGKRSLVRPGIIKSGRRQLVGLKTRDPETVLEEGAQIVAIPKARAGTPALGHVTSSYASTLGHSVTLAMIADGRQRIGEKLFVPMPAGDIEVEAVHPVFYDPAGERLNG